MTSLYNYDQQGNRIAMSDPNGHATQYAYENTGWLTTVTQTVTSQGVNQTLLTRYGYDLMGNRLSTTDANSHNSSRMNYDVLGRQTDEYDGLNNHWQMSYDGLGRMTSRTDAKNQQSTYSYDNASRLVQMSSPGSLTTSYSYNDGGQPLSMQDSSPSQTTSYSYDGLNRLTSVSNPQGVVQYSYDKLNRRTALNFGPNTSSLKTVGYGYDGLSRPISITNWQNQNLNYGYNGSRLSQLNYPNGVQAAYSFDGAERLTSINQAKGSTNIFSASYSLDNLGNRTAISENLNGTNRSLSYNYDELLRLTQESQQIGSSQAVTSTYIYDGVGNRSKMVSILPPNSKGGASSLTLTTTYGYNNADQMTNRAETGSVTPFNAYTYNYSYDANGSLTSETNAASGGESTNYSWDSRNRLTQVQKQAKGQSLSTASFVYDGNNTRLSMSYGGKTTSYLQGSAGGLPVTLQETISGQQPSSFMYPLGSTSPLFQSDPTGTGLWYNKDGLGSVRALTNSSGVVTSTNSYNAFGLNAGETGKVANDHLFAGEQLDPTGLYFNRARYFSPGIGRFIGRDSSGGGQTDPLSQNRFSYTSNNPLSYIDPTGNYQFAGDGGEGSSDTQDFSPPIIMVPGS